MAILNEVRHGEPITENDIPTRLFQEYTDQITELLNFIQKPLTTTAFLNDITNEVNTKLKFFYKFNSTTGKPVFPTGSAASDTWVEADGVATFTPV